MESILTRVYRELKSEGKIRVFGTPGDPLYAVEDVLDRFGKSNTEGQYQPTEISLVSGGALAFTARGLIKSIMQSREPSASALQDIIYSAICQPVPVEKEQKGTVECIRAYAQHIYVMLMPMSRIPKPDEIDVYGIQASRPESKTRIHAATVYLHPGQKIDNLAYYLRAMGLPLMHSANGYYMYRTSLSNLVKTSWNFYNLSIPSSTPEGVRD